MNIRSAPFSHSHAALERLNDWLNAIRFTERMEERINRPLEMAIRSEFLLEASGV